MTDRDINIRMNVDAGRKGGLDILKAAERALKEIDAQTKNSLRAADRLADSLVLRDGSLLSRMADHAESDARKYERAIERAVNANLRAAESVESLRASQIAADSRSPNLGRGGNALERLLGSAGLGEASNLVGLASDVADFSQAASGGLGALASSLGPVALVAGAASGGIDLVNRAMAEVTERSKESAAFVRVAARAEYEAQQLIASGDLEAARARRDAIAIQRQSIDAQREALRAQIEEIQSRSLDTSGLKDLPIVGGAFAALSRSVVDLTAELEAADKEFADTEVEFHALNAALNSSAAAAQVAADAFLALRERELGLATERGSALDTLGALVDQESKLTDAYVQGQQERAAARELSAARDAERLAVIEARAAANLDHQLEQQAQAHSARMESITAASNGRVEDLRASVVEAEAKYYQDSEQALKLFLRAKRDIERDSQRLERDAIEGNRIDDLLRIQEEKADRLRENRRGFNDQRKAQSDELTAFKAGVEKRIAAEQVALVASLNSTQQEYDSKLALDAETRRVTAERELADRDMRARWAAEDATAYEAKAKERFDAEVARLNDLQAAEQTRIDAAQNALVELQTTEAETATARLDNERLFREGVYRTTTALERMNSAMAGLGWIDAAAPIGPSMPSDRDMLPLPPPPVDPFGFGQFFNALPPPRESSQSFGSSTTSSAPPAIFNFDGAQFNLGEVMTIEDGKNLGRAIAAGLYEARTGIRVA